MRPDPARVEAFKRRYAALGPGPVIGIAWQSKSTSHRRKSLALEDFAPLFQALPGATFVSLQYGDTRDEIAAASQRCGVRIHRDDSFDNWADLDGLAAQIAALDHVVTVSNLNAHLAGAIGLPAHVLITQNALWYWPHGKAATGGMQSLRLTRLAEHGSTGQAIAGARASLGRDGERGSGLANHRTALRDCYSGLASLAGRHESHRPDRPPAKAPPPTRLRRCSPAVSRSTRPDGSPKQSTSIRRCWHSIPTSPMPSICLAKSPTAPARTNAPSN